jgi:hypothetical protein
MNTILEQWESFSAMALPLDAPPIQRQEMRRAFYAGAEAMARIQFSVGDRAMSEDAGVQVLEGCHDELRGFARRVVEGKA